MVEVNQIRSQGTLIFQDPHFVLGLSLMQVPYTPKMTFNTRHS